MSGSQHGESGIKSVDSSSESCSGTSGRTSGKSSSTDSADGEEQEDSSSSSSSSSYQNGTTKAENELVKFREKWQRELEKCEEKKEDWLDKEEKKDKKENEKKDLSIEEKARKLFLKGTENEQNGKLYEAIQFYRKAVQLVPDIEFKLYESARGKHKDMMQAVTFKGAESEKSGKNINLIGEGREEKCEKEMKEESEEEETGLDLLNKLQRFCVLSRCLCEAETEQKSTHISALPTEILLYILRWVVSHDLDLRSLEMCSMVCRGFYVCTRDSEIWRMACLKVWGVNCGGLTNYDSWREMFINRPRLNYNGCYISKTTYIRHGERSFQDEFYRPWHVVEYFRYLRFFPEGTVLMLTTPDQPIPVLGLLKRRQARNPSILIGHYRLHDDRVTLVLQRQDFSNNNRYRSRKNNIPVDLMEQSFHLELQVVSWKQKANCQLQWKLYCVISKRGNTETETNFDVSSNKFPPFWYSRVKSYTAESDKPLI